MSCEPLWRLATRAGASALSSVLLLLARRSPLVRKWMRVSSRNYLLTIAIRFQLVTGRTWRGTAFGGVKGRTELPGLVEGIDSSHSLLGIELKSRLCQTIFRAR